MQAPRTGLKGLKTAADESYDQERYREAFLTIQQLLSELDTYCAVDEVMRDALTITLERYCEQLMTLSRVCKRREL